MSNPIVINNTKKKKTKKKKIKKKKRRANMKGKYICGNELIGLDHLPVSNLKGGCCGEKIVCYFVDGFYLGFGICLY